jgi:hypothetical protein
LFGSACGDIGVCSRQQGDEFFAAESARDILVSEKALQASGDRAQHHVAEAIDTFEVDCAARRAVQRSIVTSPHPHRDQGEGRAKHREQFQKGDERRKTCLEAIASSRGVGNPDIPIPGSSATRAPPSSLQFCRYFAEGRAEVGAYSTHDGDGGDRNQRGKQPIFDCGHPRLVMGQLRQKLVHRVLRRLTHVQSGKRKLIKDKGTSYW